MNQMGIPRIVISALLAFCVSVLLATNLVHGLKSAGRAVGVDMEDRDGALHIDDVKEGMPAERAGFLAGDVIVMAEGRNIEDAYDYEFLAASYVESRPVEIRVLRDGQTVQLTLVPGVPFDWWYFTATAFAAVLHLILAILILASRLEGVQATLLLTLLAAIAFEIALPMDLVGFPDLRPWLLFAYWLLSGIQFSVELHLVSLIPERQPWVDRHHWAVPSFYLVGLGFGLVLAASELPALADYQPFAWFYTSGGHSAINIWMILWPAAVLAILNLPALRWPTPLGRHQALLILMGVTPWAILSIGLNLLDLWNQPMPYWMDVAQLLVLVIFPLTTFIALYRYQLFRFQFVVRQSAVYATVTTSLVLVFYAALGASGAFLSTLVEDPRTSVWIVAGATLVLGLLFGPLKKLVEAVIDRRFFPERDDMRRRLGQLGHELPQLGKLSAICDTLVERLTDIYAVEWCSLMLFEEQSGLLVSRASSRRGMTMADSKPLIFSTDDPFVDALTAANRSLNLEDWADRSPIARRCLERAVARVHPIVADDDMVGLLLLGQKKGGREFSSEEGELLDLVSRHVANVLENARLFESATLDGLTGLLRREPLLARIDDELERAIRYERPLTIGLMDLDRFKEVNDRLGHLTGDVVLQRVAHRLAETLRTTDVLGRYGGDEFMLILPETDLEGARKVADLLRKVIEELQVETDTGEVVSLTTCIGLVSALDLVADEPPTRSSVIQAADRQLYRAKHSGRNQVVAADSVGR